MPNEDTFLAHRDSGESEEAMTVPDSLSENVEKLLGRVVILGGEYPGGLVEDRTLWEAADLKYEAYVDAPRQSWSRRGSR
jgi:hypothetical protein